MFHVEVSRHLFFLFCIASECHTWAFQKIRNIYHNKVTNCNDCDVSIKKNRTYKYRKWCTFNFIDFIYATIFSHDIHVFQRKMLEAHGEWACVKERKSKWVQMKYVYGTYILVVAIVGKFIHSYPLWWAFDIDPKKEEWNVIARHICNDYVHS